jgi:LeuA allosteric (dimerisation) domain.
LNASKEAVLSGAQVEVCEDEGAAGFDDDRRAEGEADVVAAAYREDFHLFGHEVEAALGLGYARCGLEGNVENQLVAIRDAAVYSAAVVCGSVAGPVCEPVVALAALHSGGCEAGSEFNASHTRDAENQMRNLRLHRIEERLAESGLHMGKVHVEIENKGNLYYGFSANTDIITAATEAYVNAISKIL